VNEEALTVMIVEDDPIAAKIVEQFAQKSERFSVVATASTGAQAIELLEAYTPDLILLDVFLPDMSGIDLLWKARHAGQKIDFILITAANDTETVSHAMHGGAFGYIIKPIIIDKFMATLQQYAEAREQLSHQQTMGQEEVDRFFRPAERAGLSAKNQLPDAAGALPKGIDKLTLKLVRDNIRTLRKPIGADEFSASTGMSHSTVRRYLEYLVSIGEVNVKIVYGTVGRPERKYLWDK
jgi:response regulator of citrate/malate metabolism